MLSRIIRLGLLAALLAPFMAGAASVPWMPSGGLPAPDAPPGPVAVIYFNTQSDIDRQHATSLQRIVQRAKNEFGLKVQEYPLSKEDELEEAVDKIARAPVGLIVIVAPRNRQALAKIPSLYPDIRFSIIDLDPPEYFPNGHAMVFREIEGMFMIGALAAWHSKSGVVEMIASEDNARSRAMANGFAQGARYARPDVRIVENFTPQLSSESAADIAFLLDENYLPMVVRNARQQKHLLILYDHNLTDEYPGTMLTSLSKRYDLALYTLLKDYEHNRWKPGTQPLGISDGYLDYTLSSNNNTLLSESIIEKLETLKDLTAQGIVKITQPKP